MTYQSGIVRINGGTIDSYTEPFNVEVISYSQAVPGWDDVILYCPFDQVRDLKSDSPITNSGTVASIGRYFGNSLYFNGAYLGINNNQASYLTLNNNWCVECWLKQESNNFFTVLQFADGIITMGLQGTTQTLYLKAVGSTNAFYLFNAHAYSTAWRHIAFQMNNGELNIFLNGGKIAAPPNRFQYSLPSISGFQVGAGFHGNLAELAVTKGIKYTSNFTPAPLIPPTVYQVVVWR